VFAGLFGVALPGGAAAGLREPSGPSEEQIWWQTREHRHFTSRVEINMRTTLHLHSAVNTIHCYKWRQHYRQKQNLHTKRVHGQDATEFHLEFKIHGCTGG
jgi:hypothetical protein